MAEEAKIGTPWREDELDAIVADYFAMLAADLSGRSYVKSEHNRVLMARIGRTHRSVGFKHQNISAVLDELGMPWIPGYIPKCNYQNAIFDAIDRYLSRRPDLLEVVVPPSQPTSAEIFVEVPTVEKTPIPARLRRLVRKFDPVERDHRNRALGRAGEEFVIEVERRRLAEASRLDLARKIRWISAEEGDGAGYDVLSFEPNGVERLLEVKTTNGGADAVLSESKRTRDGGGAACRLAPLSRSRFFNDAPNFCDRATVGAGRPHVGRDMARFLLSDRIATGCIEARWRSDILREAPAMSWKNYRNGFFAAIFRGAGLANGHCVITESICELRFTKMAPPLGSNCSCN